MKIKQITFNSSNPTKKCPGCQQYFDNSGFYSGDHYCKTCRNQFPKTNRLRKTLLSGLEYWHNLTLDKLYSHAGINDFFSSTENLPLTSYAFLQCIPKYYRQIYAQAFNLSFVYPHYAQFKSIRNSIMDNLFHFDQFEFNTLVSLSSQYQIGMCPQTVPYVGLLPKWITYVKQCTKCGLTRPTYTIDSLHPSTLADHPDAFSLILRGILDHAKLGNPRHIRTLEFHPSQYSLDGWKKTCKNCSIPIAS